MRWLSLQIVSDIFKKRLDRVLALVLNRVGFVDDIIVHGKNKIKHDGSFIILCETARVNKLKLNAKKLQFKFNNYKFFGHKLTPDGLIVEKEKMETLWK